jgi:large-conductance mechanosensitive channel
MERFITSIIAGIILGIIIVLLPSLIFSALKIQTLQSTSSNTLTTTSESNYSYLPTITRGITNTTMSLVTPSSLEINKIASMSVNAYDKVFLIVIVSLIVALAIFLYAKRTIK